MIVDGSLPTPVGRAPARRHRDFSTSLADPSALERIVSLNSAGASAHTAAAVLNGGGSRTTDGVRWTARTVAQVISDETYRPGTAHDQDLLAARRVQDIGDLGQAIATGQLELHYQPVVDMVSGDVVSVEALVRWRHPSRGLVPPDEFVPLAEACGLVTSLTEFVARAVIAQTDAWALAGQPVRCAVNLSASSLRDPRSSARLMALLRNRARWITVEVTESVLVDDDAIEVLRELASYGVAVAIDDFGTGYSCLAALKDLPVSVLKIDRSFLRGIDNDERAAAVVCAIVQLAVAVGLDVIAEGVEVEAVAATLRDQGVRKAQGFLYARPMPPVELAAWLLARGAGS